MSVKVTSKQNAYLQELEDGPKTKNDLIRVMDVTEDVAGMMIKKLKDAGLITSKRKGSGNILEHRLILPYSELVKNGLVIRNNKTGQEITDAEIFYVAILRNAGLVGQRLKDQHRKIFPKRTPDAVGNIVAKARRERLCR